MRFLVLIIFIVALVAIFSTQNSQPVAVSFFAWKFQASLAIVVFLSALSGIIIGALLSFFIRLSKKHGTGKGTAPEITHKNPGMPIYEHEKDRKVHGPPP